MEKSLDVDGKKRSFGWKMANQSFFHSKKYNPLKVNLLLPRLSVSVVNYHFLYIRIITSDTKITNGSLIISLHIREKLLVSYGLNMNRSLRDICGKKSLKFVEPFGGMWPKKSRCMSITFVRRSMYRLSVFAYLSDEFNN